MDPTRATINRFSSGVQARVVALRGGPDAAANLSSQQRHSNEHNGRWPNLERTEDRVTHEEEETFLAGSLPWLTNAAVLGFKAA